MQLKVVCKDKAIPVREVKVGDLVMCTEGYKPVKSKFLITAVALFYKLSNGIEFHSYERILIKTTKGFKVPELWDTVYIDHNLQPLVVYKEFSQTVMVLCDILVDGSVISPEGIVMKYGND
jgi:hypothetical protein